MVSKVAVVKTAKGISEAYQDALRLIGGIGDLNVEDRDVTLKVGIYDGRNLNYPSVEAVKAVAASFTRSRMIRIAESDNHTGSALDRLQVWKSAFSDRVVPFDLSHDPDLREGLVCGKSIRFSHVLFKPNVLVSLHVLRGSTMGCVLKNLLGLIPDTGKQRFHRHLGTALVDMAQAVGGIDLAIIDGTYVFGGEWKEGEPLARERRDLLVVGRDAVAVEVVGCRLAGVDASKVKSLRAAEKRGLGETRLENIEILGEPLTSIL
jgi:uncharacterized protein (DUF362 family)